jgi:hypothetical protein
MQHNPPADDEVFALAIYMLTSARGCVDEPKTYGSLRLIEAISRLVALMESSGFTQDEFLANAKKKIDANKHLVMESEEKFTDFLDNLLREFVQELKRRNRIE